MPDGILIQAGCDDAPGLLAPEAALRRLLHVAAPVAGVESLSPIAALGRVLAEPPHAAFDLPGFDQSAMDGYALHAADLAAGAAPRLLRRIVAGDAAGAPIVAGQAVRVLTGAALPEGVAAVVMEEHATLRSGRVLARRIARRGDNIRRRGEDVARGEGLAPAGTRLDARHVALLAAAGVEGVTVRRQLRVALLSNGNELGGAVRDSNRPMLRALLTRPEVALTDLGVLPDDRAAIAAALRDAAGCHDVILATGGVSGSDADHLPGAIRDAGGEVEVLKLALKPGKPLAHGRIGDAICLCLPGNPLAALVTLLVLGRPLLARLAGAAGQGAPPVAAVSAEAFARRAGREEYVPARIAGHDAAGLPLILREGRGGSARLAPLSRADGLLWLPAACAAVQPGDRLRFHPFAAAFGPL